MAFNRTSAYATRFSLVAEGGARQHNGYAADMVYLALTTRGARDALIVLRKVEDSIWLNCGVLSKEEIEQLRANGHDVTVFTRPIDLADREAILDAVATVDEHHPNETIWSEELEQPVP
jgi:hypothetical protein